MQRVHTGRGIGGLEERILPLGQVAMGNHGGDVAGMYQSLI
jgi:hypothetical protein